MRQTGLSISSAGKVTPLALSSAMRAGRLSTSNAIVPPALALGSCGVTLVIARQPPPGRSNSTHGLAAPLRLGPSPSVSS